MDYKKTKQSSFDIRLPELNGPMRKTWQTYLADSLMAIPGFTLLFLIIEPYFRVYHKIGIRAPISLFALIMLIITLYIMQSLWRQNLASGMSALRAIGVALMELTWVGYAFRDRMGVSWGEKMRCGFCGNWRMVWHEDCPHCGDGHHSIEIACEVREAREVQKPGFVSLIWPKHDPLARAFRGMVPLYIIFVIITFNWRRWFGG